MGMFGSALTGSTTTSNFLFGRLQVNTATEIGLLQGKNSIWEVGAIQILGATAGEILSPMNAILITVMKGVHGSPNGSESALIRGLLPITGVWVLSLIVVSWVFLLPTGGFE
jgi:lactate permease